MEQENLDDIFLQKKLLEAAAREKMEIKNQEDLDMLVVIAKQCMPEVFATIIKEYKERF